MAVVSENNAGGQKGGPELQFYYNGSLAVLRHFEFKLWEVWTLLFYTPILSPKPLTAQEVIFFHRDRQYDRFYGFYENGRTETIQRYENGSIVGPAYFFDLRGRLKCRETFGLRERIGAYACYDTPGHPIRRGGA